MSKQQKEHGNTYAAQAAFEKQMYDVGIKMLMFERQLERWRDHDTWLVNMSVRFPNDLNGEYMIVLRATAGQDALVAFQGGATLSEALVGLVNRLVNGSIQWKEDKYAGR